MSCVVQSVADAVGWMEPAAQSNRRYVCRHVNVTLHQESTNCCARLLLPLTPQHRVERANLSSADTVKLALGDWQGGMQEPLRAGPQVAKWMDQVKLRHTASEERQRSELPDAFPEQFGAGNVSTAPGFWMAAGQLESIASPWGRLIAP